MAINISQNSVKYKNSNNDWVGLNNVLDGVKELPTVTAGDDGKVLKVINGNWELGEVEESGGGVSADHKHSFLSGWSDTRNDVTIPNDYNGKFKITGLKVQAAIGSPDDSRYHSLIGFRGWSDSSGGNAHELAFTGNGRIYHRNGIDVDWTAWRQILDSENYVNYKHKSINAYGNNTITSTTDDTTTNWGKHGISAHFYTATGQLIDQPAQWGYVLNIGSSSEIHQIWMTQSSGSMYHRGGNASGWAGTWREVLDSENYTKYIASSGSALPLTGGTVTGTIKIDNSQSSGYLQLFEDVEGGTIRICSKSGTYVYEMDTAADENLRIHTGTKNPNGATKMILWNGKSGNLTTDGGFVSKYPDGLRIAYGNYGFFIRNDGSNTYFMLTNSGEAETGTWNSLRPFVINNSTGAVSIQNGLSVGGGLSANSITEGGTALSSKYAAASHNHSASNITSGTLGVARGGTGATTFTSGAALIGAGTGAVTTRAITNMTSKSYINYNTNLMTTNTLAHWNGAFNTSNSSNLTYCNRGAFGTIVTKATTDYLSSTGGAVNGRITSLKGTYTSTASNRFGNSALEIRENGHVGTAQTDIGYAPSIGFHWSGRCAGTLVLDSSARFQFLNQAGSGATVGAGAVSVSGSLSGYGLAINGNATISGNISAATIATGTIGSITNGTSGFIQFGSNGVIHLAGRVVIPPDGTAGIRSNGDSSYDSGHTNYRWGTVYAKNGVKTTSDEREKDILDFDLTEMSDYFMSLKPIAYRWNYGNDDKIHFGLGAQTAERSMIENGYDPSQFDMIQHDELEEPTTIGLTERYGITYQDFHMLTMMQTQKNTNEIDAVRAENEDLKARIEKLEKIIEGLCA